MRNQAPITVRLSETYVTESKTGSRSRRRSVKKLKERCALRFFLLCTYYGEGSITLSTARQRIEKAKTFSFLRFSCCYGHIAYNKLFSSKFDIWAHRSGFGEIPWARSAHKLDHCTYLCTGGDPRSCARDTIILARHRHPHHHPVNKSRFRGQMPHRKSGISGVIHMLSSFRSVGGCCISFLFERFFFRQGDVSDHKSYLSTRKD
jgi:hypothetical protein